MRATDTTADYVRGYMKRGIMVIPIPGGEKNPGRTGWQNERWTVEDVPRLWNNGQNVGALLGDPSGGLTDVDLDVREVLRVAGRFLEATTTGGRDSAPDSHWLYYCEGIRSMEFEDLDGTTILEIRSTGRQTVFPPSVHPSGEHYRWSDNGLKAAHVEREGLLRACQELATAGLIARHLPPIGGRHRFGMALAGFLLRRGLPSAVVQKIMLAAWDAAGYPSGRDKQQARRDVEGIVRDTAEKLERGEEAIGGRVLEEIKPGLPRKISRYFGWTGREPDPPSANGGSPGIIKMLSDAITGEDHFAQDAGGKLYRFAEGTYKQYAERYIRRRVKEILEAWGKSDKWSSHKASEVAEYIRADAPELWERPPLHEVNVANGILDLETRHLRDHDPAFLSPVQIPVNFDPGAECPEWEKFVSEVFPEDAQELAFELPADLITPSRSAQKAILALGEGSNGKSTYLRALTAFVGTTNAGGVSLHKLESDRFATARLMGKLANICPDLPGTHLTETSVFKAITGGDDLHAEYKYRESFEFRPYCRLVFSANHVPRSGDASHAFFRRWLVVPFNRTFEPDEQIPREELDAKLADSRELSGVLNRALDVLPRVRREGFTESESMREAWEEFKAMTDPVSVWLAQHTVEGAEAYVPQSTLLGAFNRDCEKQGRAGMTAKAFTTAVRRAKPSIDLKQRTVGGRVVWCWIGIGLRQDDGPSDGSRDSRHSRHSTNCFGFEETPQEQDREGEGGTEETNKGNLVNLVNPVNSATPEQEQRIRELVGQGMSEKRAREEVLGKGWVPE